MTSYKHKVQYYETDKMGIVHHSNYIRWMEEARVDFLEKIEWSYDQLEKVGLVSPVLSLDIDYLHPSFFGDVISIDVVIIELKMSKMRVGYKMINKEERLWQKAKVAMVSFFLQVGLLFSKEIFQAFMRRF